MTNFPYDESVEHYPDDAEHQAYLAEWNTRVEGADTADAGTTSRVSEQGLSWASATRWLSRSWKALARVLTSSNLGVEVAQSAPEHYSLNTDFFGLQVKENARVTDYPAAAGWQSAGSGAPTPGAPGTQVSGATLSLTSVQDGSSWTTSLTATDRHYNWQLVRFDIDPETKTSLAVSEIKTTWRGYGDPTPTYPTKLYVWNFDTSSWEQQLSQDVPSPATLSFSQWFSNRVFCLTCHDNSPPSGVVIPAGVRNISTTYSGDYHGDAAGGGFGGSLRAPYSRARAAISCGDCHDSHGSANIYHFNETVNSSPVSVVSGDFTPLCMSCHQASVNEFHSQCISCHAGDGGYHGGPRTNFEGNYCLGCHTHGARWSHPWVDCHGCGEPPGYGGPSF
ncbi:MAG: hypothetical protein C4521_02375 [Actinobacteria bacterium]|nr:MAG: hypothetical protein C4521_02375 [Actinomycetota bacterium]